MEEVAQLRAALREEREQREKAVTALWYAIKRLSAGQSVTIPSSVLQLDVSAEASDTETLSDPGARRGRIRAIFYSRSCGVTWIRRT